MNQIKLSVVIPAYNEETNIRLGVLEKVARFLERRPYSWQVFVVDDGSTDQTLQLLEEFIHSNKGFTLIHNPHQGKAATVIAGMRKAVGEVVLFTDLDQATPISEVEKMM